MPTNPTRFRAQLGNPSAPGLLPLAQRLQTLPKNQNPYVPGTALVANSPVFFGREQLIHEISAGLRRPKPDCISVLGVRRIGKSSLLNQVVAKLATTTMKGGNAP